MSATFAYDDTRAAGTAAEWVVEQLLRSDATIAGLEDRRDVGIARSLDADYFVDMRDGRTALIEVKSDIHMGKTGNVLCEVLHTAPTWHPDSAIRLGWTGRTPATWLMIYSPKHHTIYHCRANDLRQVLRDYIVEMRGNVESRWVKSEDGRMTLNVLLPYDRAEHIFAIYPLDRYRIPRPQPQQAGPQQQEVPF